MYGSTVGSQRLLCTCNNAGWYRTAKIGFTHNHRNHQLLFLGVNSGSKYSDTPRTTVAEL